MTGKEDEDMPMMTIMMFVGGCGGAVLLILLTVALVRLRIRRSQHKCTVRRIPPGEEHHKDLLPSPIQVNNYTRMTYVEKKLHRTLLTAKNIQILY